MEDQLHCRLEMMGRGKPNSMHSNEEKNSNPTSEVVVHVSVVGLDPV